MSLATIHSRALVAMSAPAVQVEVHLGNGLPTFQIVGLPQAEVRESRERVRAALLNLGLEFPQRRITVNLAPADLPKGSGRYDLPIALGILIAGGQIPAKLAADIEAVGELSLSGELRPIRGAIAMALAIHRAGQDRRLVLPAENAREAALISGVRLSGIAHLVDILPPALQPKARAAAGLTPRQNGGPAKLAAGTGSDASDVWPDVQIQQPRIEAIEAPWSPPGLGLDFAELRGQPIGRRVMEIAAAGEHSALLIGPPGSGKTMLALRLATILPPLDEEAAAEVAAMASLGAAFDPADWGRRPVRAPHHTASAAALVGGGSSPRPGEISLAHQGLLFLDELPEFAPSVLEALREPLESGRITVSRAARQLEFPARFQLIAAMNPCPCGHFGEGPRAGLADSSDEGRCRCSPEQVRRYQTRLSGPFLDRIDLRVEITARPDLSPPSAAPDEDSATIRTRVCAARDRALARQGCPNARLSPTLLARHTRLDAAGRRLLDRAIGQWHLSGRAVARTLQVARTLADLARAADIRSDHIAEALRFRRALAP